MEKNTNTANTVASKAKKNKKPGFFARTWGKIKEIFSELKKVTWPSRKELISNTVTVITITLIIAAIVFVLDFTFEKLNTFELAVGDSN